MEDLKSVKFLIATRIFPDGIHPTTVSVGQVLSLPILLADGLIRDKMAVVTSAKPDFPKSEKTPEELEAEAKAADDAAKADDAKKNKK